MNPITNSPVKEKIRLKNLADARLREEEINRKLGSKIQAMTPQPPVSGGVCLVLVIIGAVIGGMLGGFGGFVLGVVAGLIIYGLLDSNRSSQNKEQEKQKEQMRQNAQREIKNLYNEADKKTQREIEQYDRDVKRYCETVLRKANTISPMIERTTAMFQRMVSHANAGSNMRFVEADFTYTVNLYGITYSYQSRYTNPQDDFNFDKERFRNLSLDAECEGLAQAVAKLTIKKMMGLYPPNSLHITVSHIDAQVTLHFKAANKNFIAAADIF